MLVKKNYIFISLILYVFLEGRFKILSKYKIPSLT